MQDGIKKWSNLFKGVQIECRENFNLSPRGFDSKDLVLLNIQQSQKTNVLTELHKINKSFSSSVICASLGTYLPYKVMCCSPAIQAKLGVLHFPCSPPQVTACSRRCCGDSASRLASSRSQSEFLFKWCQPGRAQVLSSGPPTPEEQPAPWVLLVLCPSKALSGRSCWWSVAPALKGNVTSAQNSLTKQVQLFSHSLVVHSLRPHVLSPTRLLCPWDFLARILEWVAIPFSRGSSRPREQNCISCIGRWALCH